ncbi:MAG: oxidoreductase [Cyclobacteriaceae bacterium]|jgi:uncharacterized protein YbjT (DUF2867 family)
MAEKIALVAGATGLVGRQVVELLLGDSRYRQVVVIARKPMALQHSRLITVMVNDFDDFAQQSWQADDVFCCLGTTMRQAGSREAFRKVDFDYVVALAHEAKRRGATHFLLVSALGANAKSSIFYNQVKGEVEAEVSKIGFQRMVIVRPSLLLGNRKEARFGEDVGKVVARYLGWLMPAQYRAIDSNKVARALVYYANEPQPGVFIHESHELQRF